MRNPLRTLFPFILRNSGFLNQADDKKLISLYLQNFINNKGIGLRFQDGTLFPLNFYYQINFAYFDKIRAKYFYK